MDSPNPLLNGNSQRRRLTKKPPPAHHHTSSLSIDGRIDAQSLGSRRSSASLRRAPSAPQTRTTSSNASDSSSPRYTAGPSTTSSSASRSHTSPTISGTSEFAATARPPSHPSQPSYPSPLHSLQVQSPPQGARSNAKPPGPSLPASALRPLSDKTSDELIGAPFDTSAILNRIDAIKSPLQQLAPQRPAPPPPSAPPPSSQSSADLRSMGPASSSSLPHTTSFTTEQHPLGEKTTVPKMESAPITKRFSDDSSKEPKPGVLRKKSGFSGFMTSLVGSPKKPLISAPENPVHVTHVGYDSSTGQFTVRADLDTALGVLLMCSDHPNRVCPRSGSD